MKRRILPTVLAVLSLSLSLHAGPAQLPDYLTQPSKVKLQPAGKEQAGYWFPPAVSPDDPVHLRPRPYYPLPGDLLLFDDHDKVATFLYRLAGSGPPLHAAIVIQRLDGSPALLECGPNFTPKVFILDPFPRMSNYPGDIVVRRPHHSLTMEQSQDLTAFALAQEGKDYALVRLFLQGTPFRSRFGLRKVFFGRTRLDRNRWTCSEIVVAAATVAGLMDPRRHPANAMYPGDLAHDDRYDLSDVYQLPVPWSSTQNPAEEAGSPQE